MEEQALRAAVDEVSALLSELTAGDLTLTVGVATGDIGDLYLRILGDREVRREDLPRLADLHGGGYDRPYRARALAVLAALDDPSSEAATREEFARTCGAHIAELRLCLGID